MMFLFKYVGWLKYFSLKTLHTIHFSFMKIGSVFNYRISSNSFRGIYSFQVLPAAATKRGRLLNEGGYY